MSESNFKKSAVAIPILGYWARILTNLVKAPRLNQQFLENQQTTTASIHALEKRQIEDALRLKSDSDELEDRLSKLQLVQDNLQQQFNLLETHKSALKAGSAQPRKKEGLFADDHMLDRFYGDFEDRFRGMEAMITERQKEYLSYFTDSKVNFSKTPVLDIGSGRGEFLNLLKQHEIAAVGLDINHNMVERSKKKGLEVIEGEAFSHLQSVGSQSYGAITGFHIVEHIPFNELLRIFTSAHRALVKDGFVIFETPNPENVTVGSSTFYMDPSHLHPLPPALLAFTLEFCGFRNVTVKRSHPDKEAASKLAGMPKALVDRLYGAQDYAVIGYK